MRLDDIEALLDSFLYEGYMLFPYRTSAFKNQRRWTIGRLVPRTLSRAIRSDAWQQTCDVLLQADEAATIEAMVRFLHPLDKRRIAGNFAESSNEMWQEAVERSLSVGPFAIGFEPVSGSRETVFKATNSFERHQSSTTFIAHWQYPLRIRFEVTVHPVSRGVFKVTSHVENLSRARPAILRHPDTALMASVQVVMQISGGDFVSSQEPSPGLEALAEQCRYNGAWPVLIGAEGDHKRVLCTPMITSDYPRVAPESAGDMFDNVEIDELLTLEISAMTEKEASRVAVHDPKIASLMQRTRRLSEGAMDRLHGVIRLSRTP